MKLLRVGQPGLETLCVLHKDGSYRDLLAIVDDLAGETVSLRALDAIRRANL